MERPSISKDLQNKYYIEGNWPLMRYDDSEFRKYLNQNQDHTQEKRRLEDYHKLKCLSESVYSSD